MPSVPPLLRVLAVTVVAGAAAAACSSDGGTTAGPGPLRVECPAPTHAAFAQTRFVTETSTALGIADLVLFEAARAGRLEPAYPDEIAAANRAVRAARRDLRAAATDVRTNPPLCRAVARHLERLDTGLAAFPDAIRGRDASAVATRLRGTAQAVVAAAARQNVALTPTVGETP